MSLRLTYGVCTIPPSYAEPTLQESRLAQAPQRTAENTKNTFLMWALELCGPILGALDGDHWKYSSLLPTKLTVGAVVASGDLPALVVGLSTCCVPLKYDCSVMWAARHLKYCARTNSVEYSA